MKKLIILFIYVCMPGFLFPANAEPISYPSSISEVTVYLQGAMIKRSAKVHLEPGINEIAFEGLSNFLDINSVRLECSSSITVLSVNAQTNYLKPFEKSKTETRLLWALDTTNTGLGKIRNEITTLEEEHDLLKQNYKVNIGTTGSFAGALENTADFYQKRVKEVLNRLAVLHTIESEYVKECAAIGAQINEMNGKNKRPSGEISITANATGSTEVVFVFSYYVSQARWNANYSLRAENISSDINLDYDAEVEQTTGEDWNNVKLTLSTGDPSANGIKPEFTAYSLDYKPVMKYMATRTVSGIVAFSGGVQTDGSGNVSIKGDRPGGTQYKVDGMKVGTNLNFAASYINLYENILATTFEINLQYDILSDGMAKHVRIARYALPAKFTYASLPRISTDAFLEANITGWEKYNLLPGEANIFLENSFVGKSYIDPTITNDTLKISFGRDKKINIKRARVTNFTKKQLLGAYKTQSFGYEISVRNTKKTTIEIKIEDQVPLTSQKEIVVELLESANAERELNTGKLSWRLEAKPGEEKVIRFKYSVKYLKSRELLN